MNKPFSIILLSAALIGILIQPAGAALFTISVPMPNSSYHANAVVTGAGLATGSGTAVFAFGTYTDVDGMIQFSAENTCTVTAIDNLGVYSWNTNQGDLASPMGGWNPTPAGQAGDHAAQTTPTTPPQTKLYTTGHRVISP